MKKQLLSALVLLLLTTHAWAGVILGPLSSGSPQGGPAPVIPVVTANACTVALPVTNGNNATLAGGGSCAYSATCSGGACSGATAITAWAITAQSTANAFSVTSGGVLQGGSAAASVTTGTYTVTLTATNASGTSPGVVETITVRAPPVVALLPCAIQSPVTNGVNVVLQAGGNCQYTVTCAGGACSGANAITAWAITSQTRTNGYQVTSAGILQGGTNAASITNEVDTVTVTATNAGGTSPAVGQTVTAITVPAITNQNFSVLLPFAFPQTIGTMVATANPASWAITALSAGGTGAVIGDFAISSGGVLTTTSSAPADITTAGSIAISVTATNGTGTSPTGTATITAAVMTSCPQGSAFADGCAAAVPATFQLPNWFTTPGAPNARQNGQSYTTRPPWNVAGVDYAVGLPTSYVGHLKDPTTAALPAGCSLGTLAGFPDVTCTANGITINLDGWDFGLHNCIPLFLDGNSSGTINITNSNFKNGSACETNIGGGLTYLIQVLTGSAVAVNIKNVTADCTVGVSTACTSVNDLVLFFGHGNYQITYSYFNAFCKGVEGWGISTYTGHTGNYTSQFNYGQNFTTQPCLQHGEWFIPGYGNGAVTDHFTFSFNTYLQGANSANVGGGFGGNQSYMYLGGNTGHTITLADINNNTGVANCWAGICGSGITGVTISKIGVDWQQMTVVTTNFNTNYLDPTGATRCIGNETAGGVLTNVNVSGNVNLLNSSAITYNKATNLDVCFGSGSTR